MSTHLTRGLNEAFDQRVQISNEIISKAPHITIDAGNQANFWLKDRRPQHVLIDGYEHLSGAMVYRAMLMPGEVIEVLGLPQRASGNTDVRVYTPRLLLEMVEGSKIPVQTFSTSGLIPLYEKRPPLVSSQPSMSVVAWNTNKDFLTTLLGDSLLTQPFQNHLMGIKVRNAIISIGSFFNSNIYHVNLVDGELVRQSLTCNMVKKQTFTDDDIFIRHHYGKGQIHFYGKNITVEKVEEILTWVEKNGEEKFYIQPIKSPRPRDRDLDYRVFPLLDTINQKD